MFEQPTIQYENHVPLGQLYFLAHFQELLHQLSPVGLSAGRKGVIT
jgi:hypothetical protein